MNEPETGNARADAARGTGAALPKPNVNGSRKLLTCGK